MGLLLMGRQEGSSGNPAEQENFRPTVMSSHDKPKKKRGWLIYIGAAIALSVGLAFLFSFFSEEEKELRRRIRNTVEETFPQQAAKVATSFGLTRYGEKFAEPLEVNLEAPSVVLIHGLDDPGKVWMNLAPALVAQEITVWQMRYPNDQPIVDSAWFFHDEMKRLKVLGINQVAIVAHSMGGLVSREMLTNPQIAFIKKVHTGDLPRVAGLIMAGTPNHGSGFARFRLFGEIRDQWVNLTEGQGHILRGVLDGAGEAKNDLIPKSHFLKTLNDRPYPEGIHMLIIAGMISPWDEGDIDRILKYARQSSSAAAQKMAKDLKAFLQSMSNGLGDGLVTVESTRLDGIDHRTVAGTHLSMIRNISKDSSRVPPAVPIIVECLDQMRSRKEP
ncbi:MAG: alpha/beta fold hydrolase [Gammaproteobacteria bacterium]